MKELAGKKTRTRVRSIHARASHGTSMSVTTQAVGLHRHFVQKHTKLNALPERRHYTHKTSMLAPYEGYIPVRRKGGCRNAMQSKYWER